MKTRIAAVISLLIFLVIILTVIFPQKALSTVDEYNNRLDRLPPGTLRFNQSQHLELNYRLWDDKNIIVYGHYSSAAGGNDFTAGSQNSSGDINPNGGYYVKNGTKGEYRYHGYDINGNKYTNINFINDANSARGMSDKSWINRPWDSLLVQPRIKMSDYNYEASRGDILTQMWINSTISWDIAGSMGRNYLYLFVMSPPGSNYYGEGRMWHQVSNGRVWYQTFTIPMVKKEKPDLSASVTVLTDTSGIVCTGADDVHYNDIVEVELSVDGLLHDEAYINNSVDRVTHYTREDIHHWTIELDGVNAANVSWRDNDASAYFTKQFTVGEIQALIDGQYFFNGMVTVHFKDGETLSKAVGTSVEFGQLEDIPVFVNPDCIIPDYGFDILKFPAADNTDMTEIVSRQVFINGKPVDDQLFFSGNYVFGTGNHGLKYVDVIYTAVDGNESVLRKWVYIYDTRPRAQFDIEGSFKQNRKLTISDTSGGANNSEVTSRYPINLYSWSFKTLEGDDGCLKMRDISDVYKELMYSQPGTYCIELVVSNTLGRVSEPYTIYFQILEDIGPAVLCNLDNSVLARNEKISAYAYDAVSTDGDIVSGNKIELFYDSDNDGSYDTLLNTYENIVEFPVFTPTMLGRYKFVITVEEQFGEETLEEYISDEDTKTTVVEREFLVDNYIPMTGLYVDIPIIRPQIDLFFMLDSGLDSSKTEYILDNRMNINNSLRINNILPEVNNWDMHSYAYSQAAGTYRYTGSSYPPSAIYYSSNGYGGTLSRTSVSDNKYLVDYGGYQTRTEYRTFNKTMDNTASAYYDATGRLLNVTYSWGGTNNHPVYPINESGYVGSIPKTGFSRVSGPTRTDYGDGSFQIVNVWRGYYSGTLSKTVSVWVSDWRWVHRYTGYYTGTIYKSVKQPFSDPFDGRATSDKYVVYISDGDISELSDLQQVMSSSDAKLILVGNDGIKAQVDEYHHFILNNKPINNIIDDIISYITNQNPYIEQYCILAGQDTFSMNTADYDEENDPIIETKYQYVHQPDYFDNSMGMESFAVPALSQNSGWTDLKADMFDKTGLFTIYRRIKDYPSSSPGFSNYSYYSGIPELRVVSHRKPIAYAELDWDYDTSRGLYKTSWIDLSYDLDHQYSRLDKGIIDRKIMYRRLGEEWNYTVPDELAVGTYELQYYVKDVENTWSDAFNMSFTLDTVPPIQLKAELRTLDSRFSLSGVPASEYLEVYDVWTRYPYDVKLEMALFKEGIRVSSLEVINYDSGVDVKSGNDIFWHNLNYHIPQTLPDGEYTFVINATDINNAGITTSKEFSVIVDTPVALVPYMQNRLAAGENCTAKAQTSIYANWSRVVLFSGTPYETASDMSEFMEDVNREWSTILDVPVDIPDAAYTAEFIAGTPNGNIETKMVDFYIESFRIIGVTIEGYWNHWRGQTDIFGEVLSDEPHRFLSLERVKINVYTTGYADKVVIRFSPELEAMEFTDMYGNIYNYADDYFGYYINFPDDSTFILNNEMLDNHVYWEYAFPLAQSTKDWSGTRIGNAYNMTVTVYKGDKTVVYVIDDIDITGNIYDLVYIQPIN